ncbi:MAG: 30S ribosomal protein S3, partial [Thermoplasmata archaeon]|nr:30S ribosomal protein S3 [Thermoplasmata archaeon]
MASERKFVAENIRRVLLKEFFQKEVEMAGFGGIDIQRTPMGTRVTLTVERPGMVIGRKGAKIKDLTRKVSDVYGFDNPQIEVQECRDPSTNPQIMAQKLALALERGWHFRRAGHSTLRRIQGSAVKGCQVRLSGKLTGQRHRTEKFKWGHIKFCGEPSLTAMDHGYAIAKKKLGLIGVTVDIMKPDATLPDEITIKGLPTIEEVAEVSDDAPVDDAPVEQAGEVSEGDNAQKKASDVAEDAPETSETPKEAAKEKEISKRKQKRKERQKAKEEEKPADAGNETVVSSDLRDANES